MKINFFVVLVFVSLYIMCYSVYAQNKIKIYVNGVEVIADKEPILKDGTTYVPMRTVVEAMNCVVEWDGKSKTVNIAESDTIIAMQINNKNITKLHRNDLQNTEIIKANTAAIIIDDSTYIPLRTMAEALDCDVSWDQENKIVSITTDFDTNSSNIKIRLDGTTLYIIGHGSMKEYNAGAYIDDTGAYWSTGFQENRPWKNGEDYIKKIIVEDGITDISQYAFNGFRALKSVELPDSVTKIGEYAFARCYNLKDVKLSDNIVEIEKRAFLSCESLDNINMPRNLKKICSNAFEKCRSLKNLVFYNGNLEISSYAFMECENLSNVTLPEGMKELQSDAFSYTGLTSIKIPDSVTKIGGGAFIKCQKLKSVELPANLTEIGSTAFGLTALESIVIPAGTHSLERDVFRGCKNLKEVTFLGALDYLPQCTFQDCTSLKTVRFEDKVKDADKQAFSGCKNITNVYCKKGCAVDNPSLYGLNSVKITYI